MGQLVIRYRSQNPGIREVKTQLELSPSEAKDVEGVEIQEIILNGKVFVPKESKTNDDRGKRGE